MNIEERWNNAQIRERQLNNYTMEEGLAMYGDIYYKNYFEHLKMDYDQKGKTIMEIGCADFPALHFCNKYNQSKEVQVRFA